MLMTKHDCQTPAGNARHSHFREDSSRYSERNEMSPAKYTSSFDLRMEAFKGTRPPKEWVMKRSAERF